MLCSLALGSYVHDNVKNDLKFMQWRVSYKVSFLFQSFINYMICNKSHIEIHIVPNHFRDYSQN